jgi:hypothetical protein
MCRAPGGLCSVHFAVHVTSFLQSGAKESVIYTSQNITTFSTNRDIQYTHYERLGHYLALQKESERKRYEGNIPKFYAAMAALNILKKRRNLGAITTDSRRLTAQ